MKINDPGVDLKMGSYAPAGPPKPSQLSRQNARGRIAVVRGQDGSRFTDFYHQSLMASWPVFILGLLGIFVAVNLVFAALYMTDPRGLSNAAPGDFWARFIFSVQTMGSIAYTDMVPKSHYVDVIVMAEAFVGILYIGMLTAVMFARMSRPSARFVFSNVAVVLQYDGVPTLMFRAANQRGNQVLDASINVTLARSATSIEGITMRRFEDLTMVRNRTSLFALSWSVMHRIDETSPLHGLTQEQMMEQDMEIVVLLSGRDDVLADTIYARHAYSPDAILWDRKFVDVLSVSPQGRLVVDLALFHDTEPHLT
ncbi:MAG: ATP-sensitive inward rectifier potassium channel 10 [Proteobacteria bacterium]|nr:ATP-sensitive inward rectifier potassium channel 10 [Pseudomonadota bacterium]